MWTRGVELIRGNVHPYWMNGGKPANETSIAPAAPYAR
jgi:hypothetical protein